MSAIYTDATTLWARALRRVTRKPNGCWYFTGSTNSRGYGLIASGRKGRTITTHRLALMATTGLDDHAAVDHTCHNADTTCPGGPDCQHRRCVNPAHLEAVTVAVNNARAAARKNHCAQGHPLTTRTRGDRIVRCCRTCENAARRARTAA